MWAQGLTLGVLIAAGVMTHTRRAKEMEDGVRHVVRRRTILRLAFVC